ncbi:fructosamine kinase family protein [Subsaximicrobium wynnwilliamsii]|uniref:Fructosamine kinase family protein n=1 Tax=Subsaximicrobium wynnwilliamsii TaxID=291179 RepID=A0A5C6ZAX7_9FLAO|nr:fructosamine kinase family protein [Subsaximicrobium wynnwilliamsii]TXD81417.1 fructosamine kinase family protein [Subsaximicrobium wynnwilliamsii]TXD87133.1 fructosamine kinase family protein [Subsaximicrobium wynnwilliamsii]TXE00687.1 fructosamine kinase family protein [Subsaximicrobium wynnwilliamsii]
MFPSALKNHLEERFSLRITSAEALSGGDINEVYLLKTNSDYFVVKLNAVNKFPDMFEKESAGLKALRDTETIDIPEVLSYGDFEAHTYLIMAYRKEGAKQPDFWEGFGTQLADLHQHSNARFGFEADNYYGSLPQYNDYCDSAHAFYIEQRLKPQFKLARDNGYEFKHLDAFYKQLESLIPDEKPALLHGDLWSGNYLTNSKGEPCLVDPAVAYGPREMDLAMMRLFGGFDPLLFQAYDAAFSLEPAWKDRIKLWQLYYILGHVNLFGGHYYAQAKTIIAFYS